MNDNGFKLYSASAGSGKTYTLVKEILKILVSTSNPNYFDSILAITFTNKAANEMKTRLLSWLHEISEDANNGVLIQLENELGIEKKIIQKRAKNVLIKILHNYSRFSISTIDKFNLKLTRSFAKDLGIASNLNIELDTKKVLQESLDLLYSKLEKDENLTKTLINLSLRKMDEDKSWWLDVDFLNIYGNLFSDQHKEHLEKLGNLDSLQLSDFRKNAFSKIEKCKNDLRKNALEAISILQKNHLKDEFFLRKSLPNFFKKIANSNFDFPTDGLVNSINKQQYFAKTLEEEYKNLVLSHISELLKFYNSIESLLTEYFFWKKIVETAPILSLINEINKSLTQQKTEQQLLLISDVNGLISKHLQEQPAAYIYERIGNRYQHIFIDEFQDTSDLQWNNFYPLVENARAINDSVLLVGDVKQSIYRWRGGNPNLMIDLMNEPDVSLKNLDKNWRSREVIVEFNNALYKSATALLMNTDHKKIYEKGAQEINSLKGGYVQINLFEQKRGDSTYSENTLNQIENNILLSKENGFEFNEIVVLCRTKAQAKNIAKHLVERNIQVLSNEALLLNSSEYVQLFIKTFQLLEQRFNQSSIIEFLMILKKLGLVKNTDFTEFSMNALVKAKESLISVLKNESLDFDFLNKNYFSLYDLTEEIIRALKLEDSSNVYVQSFLDVVLNYSGSKGSEVQEFLLHWNHIKESESVQLPEGINAVKILTIHKSKGLEFPVVIVPFIDDWAVKDSGIWIPLEDEELEEFYINGTNKIEHYSVEIEQLIHNEKQLRTLDELNLLYVATTRAKEQLYLIGKSIKKESSSFAENVLNQIPELKNSNEYCIGFPKREHLEKEEVLETVDLKLRSNSWENKIKISTDSASLWDESKKNQQFGTLIHNLLAEIFIKDDVKQTLFKAELNGLINQDNYDTIEALLKSVVEHPSLTSYFSNDFKIYNERDFLNENGEVFRPDRLMFKDNYCIILDYKTGIEKDQDEVQVKAYASYFTSLGYTTSSYLIYINDSIQVKEIVG